MYRNLNEISEEIQLEKVKQNGLYIRYINNPSEEVQLEAVRKYGYAIQYIKNPSLELQIEAVKQYPYIIMDLKMDNNDVNRILKVHPDIKLIQYLINEEYQFTKEFMNTDEYIKAKLLMK